ncbi:hypothetical protein CIK06_27615 [Plantactinospora sp. KBS50]|nr:hypothetical protein CIK06_27615 [Plantactinospora sp. KBS50]
MTADDLFAAILANPEDLDLRLRYADAIQATDPDHAELIRAAISGSDINDRTLRRRLAGNRRLASRPVDGLVDSFVVRNGFVESVTMSGTGLLDHGDLVWQRAPVRHLKLTDIGDLLPRIVASPLLDRLTALDLSGNPIGDAGVRVLADGRHLRRLRWLRLNSCEIGAAGAETLAATRNLPALRYVGLDDNRVPITPYGSGQDITGGPLWVERPPLADDLDARYGPLPWLSSEWARSRGVPWERV